MFNYSWVTIPGRAGVVKGAFSLYVRGFALAPGVVKGAFPLYVWGFSANTNHGSLYEIFPSAVWLENNMDDCQKSASTFSYQLHIEVDNRLRSKNFAK